MTIGGQHRLSFCYVKLCFLEIFDDGYSIESETYL